MTPDGANDPRWGQSVGSSRYDQHGQRICQNWVFPAIRTSSGSGPTETINGAPQMPRRGANPMIGGTSGFVTEWTAGALTIVVRPYRTRHALIVLRAGVVAPVFTVIPRGMAHWREDPIGQDVRDAIAALWDDLEDVGFKVDGHPSPHSIFNPCAKCAMPPYVWCVDVRTSTPIKWAHKDRWL